MAKEKNKKTGSKKMNKKLEKELHKTNKLNNDNDSENVLKRFVIIFIVIMLVVVGIYLLSKQIVDNRDTDANDEVVAGEINYDVISVGMLLNRPYEEYYIMIYNAEDVDSVFYSSIISKYQQKEGATKIYFCDLSNSLNSKYSASDGKSNPDAKNIEDLKFGKLTLIKVKEGKINKYIEDLDTIKTTLQ